MAPLKALYSHVPLFYRAPQPDLCLPKRPPFLRRASLLDILLSTGIVSLGLWIVYHAELKQGYIAPMRSVNPQAVAAAE